jgi:predicted ATPase
LEAQFPETAVTQPELLAQHYTEAGRSEQALPCWRRAGERAFGRSANLEAVAHLTTGVEVLTALPDTPERTQHELPMLITLGQALIATRGYAAPEVGRVYIRARQLCQQVGERAPLFPALYGLWAFYNVRAEHQTARELGEECLRLAEHQPDPAPLLVAHRILGTTLLYIGEWTAARGHMERTLALYAPQQHRSLAFLYAQDPAMAALSFLSWTQWALGFPAQALARSHEALTLARDVSHPHSLAFALGPGCKFHQFRREVQATQAQAETWIALSTAHGFSQGLAESTILRGWALAVQGQGEEGMAHIRQGLAAFRATGAELYRPYMLALLAEAYGQAGQPEAGLAALAEALGLVDKTGERYWEVELHRLKGELLLAVSPAHYAEATTCFHHALDIARRQQAKSLELRAAMSLARLWQHQGKRAEAHELLVLIYGWFTEGFDTADLKEAKVLLEALV